jgi:hypothetical protein
MSSKFELLYNQLSEDQINQIIQGLRGEQPMNNGIEIDEQLVNNEKMASYSQVVSGNNRQDKNQDTDDTNEHNNQFPKQGYTLIHRLLTSQSLNDLINLIFTQLIIQ